MAASNVPAPYVKPLHGKNLHPGEAYDSWLCGGCSAVIAIAPRSRQADPQDMPEGDIAMACPYCETVARYKVHDRLARRFPW